MNRLESYRSSNLLLWNFIFLKYVLNKNNSLLPATNLPNPSLYWWDPKKLAIQSLLRPEGDLIINCGQIFKKTVCFADTVLFIDEENNVTYVVFECGISFYPEIPTKVRQISRERNYISRSCEKPKFIPGNNQLNCSFDEQHSSNTFLNPYNSWDMVPAALMSLKHTNDR